MPASTRCYSIYFVIHYQFVLTRIYGPHFIVEKTEGEGGRWSCCFHLCLASVGSQWRLLPDPAALCSFSCTCSLCCGRSQLPKCSSVSGRTAAEAPEPVALVALQLGLGNLGQG